WIYFELTDSFICEFALIDKKYFIQGDKVNKNTGRIYNMASGSTARMRGPSISQSEGLRIRQTVDDLQRELIERAHETGLTPEIKDIIESVDDARRILTKKNFELNILETLAMESTDENISDLREQLFTTVKLVHQDLVNEIMVREYRDDGLEPSSVYGDKIDMGDDRDGRITQKVRIWFFKRKEMREKLKQYKKNLKTKMDIEGY
ncbi:hypothetical protein LCGC14_1516140, partial [marine sediment metagenome]